MTARFRHSAASALLSTSRCLVAAGKPLVPYAPERVTRAALARALGPYPQLWGWSGDGERRRSARCSYERAFPHEDPDAFIAEAIAARALALATSMTYIARTHAGRRSKLVQPLTLVDANEAPCIITHLHYAIDPALQLALIAANDGRRLRWAVYPARPSGARRWAGERSLLLAARIPHMLSETLLYVSEPSWLIEALRHLKLGGSVLLALDSLLDARRAPATFLEIGQARMPVSPAIELLADASGARLLFTWPQLRPDDTWNLHCDQFTDTAALAAAASRWIEANRVYWTGWPHLIWRLRRTDMERDLVPW
jgi:hypothetical protein